MPITLIPAGSAGGDCEQFAVELDGVETVRDLLAAIRAQRPGDEYGVIAVRDAGFATPRESHAYHNPNARRDGPPDTWDERTLDARVVDATASGGWSRMDYQVTIE